MTNDEAYREMAIEQFARRFLKAENSEKVDNSSLHAGQPMYYYCQACGTQTEVLPEDHLFSPHRFCSQCQGLENEHLLSTAIAANGGKVPTNPKVWTSHDA